MELVVLVDEYNNEIGTAPKDSVHTDDTPLHRGFSLFLFNSKGELLVTKRARNKTFPGLWSNTVCGHPGPGESVADAAKRRVKDELGIDLDFKRSHLAWQGETLIREISPYRYRFTDANGIIENEICPILTAHADVDPKPNQEEVAQWKWIDWKEFLTAVHATPAAYSPWCREEARIVEKFQRNVRPVRHTRAV